MGDLRARQDAPGRALLTSFAFLWSSATLYHELAYRLAAPRPADLLLVMLAVLVLAAPRSLALFSALVLAQLGAWWQALPDVSNHWFFEAFVSMTLLAAIAREALRSRRARFDRERLLRTIAPVLRLEMLLLYAVAAFDKLNFDYLDPEVSCASHIQRLIAGRLPLYPSGPWAEAMAIPVSILIEGGLPLLLLVPRTRIAGLIVGVAFHLILSASSFPPGTFSFGGMLLALYALFLPEGSLQAVERRLIEPRAVRFTIAAAALVACAVTAFLHWPAGHLLYVAEALAALAFLLRPALGRLPRESAVALLRHPWPALALFAALVLLNGLAPYLGLKTGTAFSMFSNLRTEGGATNHILIARPLRLCGYQEDLVTIVRSSDPGLQWYADHGFRMVWFEFHDSARYRKGQSVTYRRGGEQRSVTDLAADPELKAPTPRLLRKLLLFRRARVDGPVPCEH